MRLRVLHVIPAVAPRYGGPSAAVVGLCRALLLAGADPMIATTDADGSARLDVLPGVRREWQGVPAIFFPRAFSESYKWSGALASWVAHHAADFDVIHVHAVFSHASLAAGRAARAEGRPYLVRPLGALDPWSLGHHRWRKKLLLASGGRTLLMGAAAIHYTTEGEQRLAESRVPGLPAGVVVPLGVDEEYFEAATPVDGRAPYILTLSRLDDKKRLGDLIRAFHALDGSTSDWSLVIAGVGNGATTARLHQLANDGPARGRIEFAGWVDGPRKLDLIRGASLFALPSHQENFGLGLIEAMACGVPVLVTPGVNLAPAIVAGEGGWLLDVDAEGWSAALRSVLSNRPEMGYRARAARTFAARFRWSTVAAEMLTAYRHAIDDTAVSVVPVAPPGRASARPAGGRR
jgi:glycosyltransferase involved in cell wall biosynthesis